MQIDRIENAWIDAFVATFSACGAGKCDSVIILSESQSREINVELTELALARLEASYFHLRVPTKFDQTPAILRSTGASQALNHQPNAVNALKSATLIIDLTIEGLMHARQTGEILSSGARILTVSNEHPEVLGRLLPDENLKEQTREAARRCRAAKRMLVTSEAGTELTVDMDGNQSVGVWGWTDRPGTLAHWPGGIVVSFPKSGSVSGDLIFQPGDMNLTFKRYFEDTVRCRVEDDYITKIDGPGSDAKLMRDYLEAFGDREAYATSHVGWGLNKMARYEAMTMYDKRDYNGTELRAVAGNFLYSTGANEFANRFTQGHFDLPMMGCSIFVDDHMVVDCGRLTE